MSPVLNRREKMHGGCYRSLIVSGWSGCYSLCWMKKNFLSPYGIRSISKVHLDKPYTLSVDGLSHTIGYQPAESTSGLFGGNSNWRGPVWFPINYLLIESLQKYHHFYGDSLKVECPHRLRADDESRRSCHRTVPAPDQIIPARWPW